MKCDTIPDLEKFLAIQEQALGPATPEVATTLTKLAELHFAKGNLDIAERLYQRSFDIRSVLHGYNRQGIEQAEQRLSQIKLAKSKPASVAGTSAAAPHTPSNEHPEPIPQAVIQAQATTGNHTGFKATMVAIEDLAAELELLKQMVGQEHTAVADLSTKLADLYCRVKMYNKMEPLLVDAVKIREAICGPEHPSVATELKNLGTLYCTQERYALAEPLLKRAITLREKAYGRSHVRVIDAESQYAHLLRKTNRVAQAEELERHVNEIRNGQESTVFSCDSSSFGAAKPRR